MGRNQVDLIIYQRSCRLLSRLRVQRDNPHKYKRWSPEIHCVSRINEYGSLAWPDIFELLCQLDVRFEVKISTSEAKKKDQSKTKTKQNLNSNSNPAPPGMQRNHHDCLNPSRAAKVSHDLNKLEYQCRRVFFEFAGVPEML